MAKRKKNKHSDYLGRSKGESLASIIFRDQNPLDNLNPVEELPEMSQAQSGGASGSANGSSASNTASSSDSTAKNKKSK